MSFPHTVNEFSCEFCLFARKLDPTEAAAMTEYYSNMLSCQYKDLPPEAMAHYFLSESTAMDSFMACIHSKKRKVGLDNCKQFITPTCTSNLVEMSMKNNCPQIIQTVRKVMDEHPDMQDKEELKKLISQSKEFQQVVNGISKNVDAFISHETCVRTLRADNAKCINIAMKKCQSDNLHVVQVNRMKVEDLEGLIQEHPDLYVIHYLRDPRAIAASRVKTHKLYWDKSDRRAAREARILCHRMSEDLRHRKRLAERYPGVFMQLKYEDFAIKPIESAQTVYNLFGGKVPPGWAKFSKVHMSSGKGSGGGFGISVKDVHEVAYKWRKNIPADQLSEIKSFCGDYFRNVSYPFS